MVDLSASRSFAQQRVLDASLQLLAVRRAALAELDRGTAGNDIALVAGTDRLNAWMMQTARTWRHLLSSRPATTATQLASSLGNNRSCVQRGLHMVSVFDHDGTDPTARDMLRAEGLDYRFSYAPVQMRLVDQRDVYLHGPGDLGRDSILRLRGAAAVNAARAYWAAVDANATPCGTVRDTGALTDRQRIVFDLLAQELTDERIAERLHVSLRTVRADIAAAMRTLGVRSRFAAGQAWAASGAARVPVGTTPY